MSWLMIIALIGFGCFIGIVIDSASKARGKMLQQDFISLGTLAGRPLAEIENVVGKAQGVTACMTMEGKPGSLYTWVKYPYSITLLFDENLICLGVNQELVA